MGEKDAAPACRHMLAAYGYMAMWICLSAGVIMLNKYILDPKLGGFPFPLTLTGIHMLFCSAVSWGLVRLGMVDAPQMPIDTYVRSVLPIGALFAVTLWMGNSAYLYLSVSFIQMLKAVTPLLVYFVGTFFGTEKWCLKTGSILLMVVCGVLTASYGEVVFVMMGFLCQCASLISEATRLTLVQTLLQGRGIQLNPITTMYCISPVCCACLLIPFAVFEAEKLTMHTWQIGPGLLLMSAAAAFALNCSIYLLIGKTSALTMNIAGVAKDMLLIYLSMAVYGSIVTELQFSGYSVALCGAFFYNYHKQPAARTKAAATSNGAAAESLLQRSDTCGLDHVVKASFTDIAAYNEDGGLLPHTEGFVKAAWPAADRV